jgi:hypothetical protein
MSGIELDAKTGKPAVPHPGLTIYVPSSIADVVEIVGKCNVPGCGAIFRAGEEEAWQKHVGACGRRHMERLHAAMAQPGFMEDWDPEITAHMRGVGRRMAKERRLEIKPNERAGFS